MKTLDFKTCSEADIKAAFKELIQNKLDKLEIKNVYPGYFEDVFDMRAYDFNAFDFWGHITYEGKKIPVCGDMWWGKITFSATKTYKSEDYMFGDDEDEEETSEETNKDDGIVVKDTYVLTEIKKDEAEIDEGFKDGNYKKFYFWHDSDKNCKYTLVYSENENLARRVMIDLWGSFQDICISTEKLKELEQEYRERWPYCLPRTTFSGTAYTVVPL